MTLPFYPAYQNTLLQQASQAPSPFLEWSVVVHLLAVFGYALFGGDEA